MSSIAPLQCGGPLERTTHYDSVGLTARGLYLPPPCLLHPTNTGVVLRPRTSNSRALAELVRTLLCQRRSALDPDMDRSSTMLSGPPARSTHRGPCCVQASTTCVTLKGEHVSRWRTGRLGQYVGQDVCPARACREVIARHSNKPKPKPKHLRLIPHRALSGGGVLGSRAHGGAPPQAHACRREPGVPEAAGCGSRNVLPGREGTGSMPSLSRERDSVLYQEPRASADGAGVRVHH